MMKIAISIAVIALALAAAPSLNAQDVAVTVKEAKAGLLAQATVKPDSAQRVALAKVPGGKITEVEIEEENGKLVYEVKIAGPDGSKHELYVDAKTGAFVEAQLEKEPAEMGAGISEQEAGLLAQATVKPDSAERVAALQVPGGKIVKRTIEREDGKLVYSFEFKVEGKEGVKEVTIDAMTGALVKVEDE